MQNFVMVTLPYTMSTFEGCETNAANAFSDERQGIDIQPEYPEIRSMEEDRIRCKKMQALSVRI
jgi:hypothetical protein